MGEYDPLNEFNINGSMLFRTTNEIMVIGKMNFDANMLQAYPIDRESVCVCCSNSLLMVLKVC
jgi:hypothetical protein